MNIMLKSVAACLLFLPQLSAAMEPLRLAVHPYLPPIELIERFTPIKQYLEQKTEREISIHIASSYEQLVSDVINGNVDIAYMGPALYASISNRKDVKPLVKLSINGSPFFNGAIVTSERSTVKHVKDLIGKRFAFGDIKSTMSHIVPRYELEKRGITVKHLDKFDFLGSHQNVALAVLMGKYDAGAVKEEVYQKYRNRGLRLLLWTRKIPEHLFVASSALSTAESEQIQEHLLRLRGVIPQHRQILHAIKPTVSSLAPAYRNDYEELNSIFQHVSNE